MVKLVLIVRTVEESDILGYYKVFKLSMVESIAVPCKEKHGFIEFMEH